MILSNNHSHTENNAAFNSKENNKKISKDGNNEINEKDFWSNQCNNILSYYYTTCIYLLNCENNYDISYINKSSKNFVLKNKMNLIAQNKLNNINIYNVNFINNCLNNNNNYFFVNKSINFNNNLMNKSINNINYNDIDLFKLNNIKNSNNVNLNYNEFQAKILEESFLRNKYTGALKDNNDLVLEDCLIVKYGRKGWVCRFCNNFNYEMRIKCNRCGIIKNPKKVVKISQKSERDSKKREDWICHNCSNLNYSFRTECNRCKMKLSENNQIPYQELKKEKL